MGYNIHSSHIKIHGNKCELISRIQNTHYMFTLHSIIEYYVYLYVHRDVQNFKECAEGI